MEVTPAIVLNEIVLLAHVDKGAADVNLLGVQAFEVLSADDPWCSIRRV